MTATTKVKDVLWRVSTLLDDTTPQFNRWTESALVNWLNDGQLAITKFLPSAVSRIISMKLRQGTLQSIESILAADHKLDDGTAAVDPLYGVACLTFFNNMGANGTTPGDALPPPVDRKILDVQRPNWHVVSGSVVRQVVFDPKTPKQFFVQPAVPATPAVWLRVALTARPTLVPNTGAPGAELYLNSGGNATLISLSDEWVEDLVNYVVARAFMTNTEYTASPQNAVAFANLFLSSLNAAVTALTGVNPNLKRLPFAPEPIGAAS